MSNFLRLSSSKNTFLALLLFLASFVCLLFFQVQSVSAQQERTDFGVGQIQDSIQLGGGSLIEIIGTIINVFLGLLGIIALIMMLYGGYQIMTAAGNEEKVENGKDTIINAVIGLVIIMSSLTIVNFIMNALSDATGVGQDSVGQSGNPNLQSYQASGALGNAIEDHYPQRNQKDVKRNTKITVTFAKPIVPSSTLKNTNGSCWHNGGPTTSPAICNDPDAKPYYGDCLQEAAPPKDEFDWSKDCDQIRTSSIQIAQTSSKKIDDINKLIKAAGTISYTTDGNKSLNSSTKQARTFVFKPINYLGSKTKKQWHLVSLTQEIREDKGQQGSEPALDASGYKWNFQVGTDFDFEPPKVVEVHPDPSRSQASTSTISKNEIISITFNEAVDPTRVQGVINTKNDPLTNIIFSTTSIKGEWRITNGYKTVEFQPYNTCGTNSCGDTLYCLDIGCPSGKNSCKKDFTILGRTSNLLNPESSWIANPAGDQGILDMAGNALDTATSSPLGGDGKRQMHNNDHTPPYGNGPKEIGSDEKQADNLYWTFEVKNKIDRRVPYIHEITPSVDSDNLRSDHPINMQFSMPMRYGSLESVELTEFASTSGNIINPATGQNLADIWYSFKSENTTSSINGVTRDITSTTIRHRKLGPNDLNLFYLTSVSSSVQGVNQNCLYPGAGPQTGDSCTIKRDKKTNQIKKISNCSIKKTYNSSTDTGCPDKNFGNNKNLTAKANIPECKNSLKQDIQKSP